MNTKSILILSLKIIGLTILYLIIFLISGALLSFGVPQPPEEQMSDILRGVILMVFVYTSVTSIIILRSRRHGWRLALTTGFSMFGVITVMSMIEVAFFGPALGIPYSMLPGLFLPDLVALTVFVPLAVLILGKRHAVDEVEDYPKRAVMPPGEWLVKLAVIAVIYCALYFSFGLIFAWSNPELRAAYGGGTNQIIFSYYSLIPLQVFRSVLWVLFALPVIRMTKGKTWQVALLIGLFYSLPMTISLVIPSFVFPSAGVRMSHFIETTSSNFIFGLIVTWLLHRSHSSLRDLFGLDHAAADTYPDHIKVA